MHFRQPKGLGTVNLRSPDINGPNLSHLNSSQINAAPTLASAVVIMHDGSCVGEFGTGQPFSLISCHTNVC